MSINQNDFIEKVLQVSAGFFFSVNTASLFL